MDPGQDPISPEGEGGRTTWREADRKGLDGQDGNKSQAREVGNQGGQEEEEERVHE